MDANELKYLDFNIISSCDTNTKGIDIVAERDNKEFFIEAKGGTTSKRSAKEGRPFNRNQAKTHISVAIFKLLQLRENNKNALLAIALPYERDHVDFINSIETSLKELGIVLFWCDNKEVRIQENNIRIIKNTYN